MRTKFDSTSKDDTLIIVLDGESIGAEEKYEREKLFLLPSASESYHLDLPHAFPRVIQEMYRTFSDSVPIPNIEITISYSDVQGKKYVKRSYLSIETMMLVSQLDGGGAATYRLAMKESNDY